MFQNTFFSLFDAAFNIGTNAQRHRMLLLLLSFLTIYLVMTMSLSTVTVALFVCFYVDQISSEVLLPVHIPHGLGL